MSADCATSRLGSGLVPGLGLGLGQESGLGLGLGLGLANRNPNLIPNPNPNPSPNRDEQGRSLYSCGSDMQALPTELMSGIPLMLMRAG